VRAHNYFRTGHRFALEHAKRIFPDGEPGAGPYEVSLIATATLESPPFLYASVNKPFDLDGVPPPHHAVMVCTRPSPGP